MKELIKKYCTREVITYLIAGVATTAVNYVVTFIMFNLIGIEENTTTIVAWIIAVIFAYFVNAYWVFVHKYESMKDELSKFGKFVAARLFTLVVEEAGIYIFVTRLAFNMWLVKIPLNVIVIVLNYVFSKLLIFVRKKNGD